MSSLKSSSLAADLVAEPTLKLLGSMEGWAVGQPMAASTLDNWAEQWIMPWTYMSLAFLRNLKGAFM